MELDAVVVGAGLGGVYALKKLRDEGFKVKLLEAGSSFGGVWYWNRYPSLHVDVPIPYYQFSDPELWTDWSWSQRFPSSEELRAYFEHIDEKWNLRKDCLFDHCVDSAVWNEGDSKWDIHTQNGEAFKAQFLLASTGFAYKRYVPDWKGVDSFQGLWIHPSTWPKEGLKLEGKKVAVIGTGATGIQLSQALAPIASKFVLFQRTPNLTLPMGQEDWTDGTKIIGSNDEYQEILNKRSQSFGGDCIHSQPKMTFDDSLEKRKEVYESLYAKGDFHFWVGSYPDLFFNDEANTEAYNFWREKVRARLKDSRLREKFAPTIKPHAFGIRRVSLENGFYEQFERPNVHLVDVNDTPIVEVTTKGIRTTEIEWKFDVIISATGYDALTGGLVDMNIVGKDGLSLSEHWKDGTKTYLGVCVSGFPNMFYTYGPHSPGAISAGPSCIEVQVNWIVRLLKYMHGSKLEVVNALKQKEEMWSESIHKIANNSLFPTAKSFTMGANIPGKRVEPLVYLAGLPNYHKALQDCSADGYEGFEFKKTEW